MTKLIGICGRSGTGKDTAGKIIQDILGEEWEIRRFGGKLKEIASLLTGVPTELFEDQEFKRKKMGEQWVGGNGMELCYRDFLQRIGTEALRHNVCENVWVNALFQSYIPENKWIITDLRFLNEYRKIMSLGGITIRMVREGIPKLNHHSETALQHIPTHYIIENSESILDLENNLKIILRKEKLI